LRLALDATAVSPLGKGVARAQRSLAETLARRGNVEVVALVGGGVELAVPTEAVRSRPAVVWEQIGLAGAARRYEIVVTPTERLPVASRGRFVVWLFETPTRRLAQRARRGLYQRGSDLVTRGLWRRSLRQAAAVVAGSEATADDLEAAIPELAGKVRVIHPGIDTAFHASRRQGPTRDRYVFHLGSADPRDNTETVLHAFALARDRVTEPVRLIVGGDTGARRLPGVELTGRVPDEQLAGLYAGAAAYLDASLFEGFGYQPLEAMACGAPVVGSNASATAEVVGSAGVLCDPEDPEALADALVNVLEDPALADELRSRGYARAAEFSWDKAAAAFEQLAEELT
jgi:glycosyltransferase involved in cell wall biosynthesis